MPSPTHQSCCCDTVMPVIFLRQLTLSLLLLFSVSSCHGKIESKDIVYHNQFAVHIPNASVALVEQLAVKHGFRSLGQIGSLEGYFLFQHDRIHKRSADPSDHHHGNLANEPGVAWVEQQYERKRVKRDFASNPAGFFALGRGTEFPDPFYRDQWYLHGGSQEGFDMNVIPAWAKGYSGKGIVVSILDDGIQTNHPDLVQNYDPLASSDINDNDNDPMPRDNGDNKHGTRCAGEVAAAAFNSYCGVGVAFNASIGGVRMLDGTVNDAVEARALSLNPDHIDIYSASWGPEDDGKTVDGPGPLAKRAFINGIMKGRSGKGSIFVWASGNGGRHEDSCNCDGYTNSIFTLSISSATQGGFKPWYLEECSSTLATTYSSGRPDVDRSIATVDMDGALRPDFLCTSEHTGTSASAPIAAGICALALEANPNLTWRDMQHLVVFTSRPDPLHDNSWVVNGIGKKVSHKYGYGLMDAAAMVTLAEQWTNVPPQHVCQTPADTSDRPIPNGFGQKLEVVVETDACAGSAHEIRFLEHVQCRISLRFAPRGNLRIRLTSPSGTQSVLLFERPRDVLDSSFDDWPFMSVHFWGERAAGRWKLEVLNAGNKRVSKAGILKKWQLVFYGTDTNPVRLRSPQTTRPGLVSAVSTIGRDVHGQTFPSPVSTPFASTFSNIGRDPITPPIPAAPAPTTGFARPVPFPGNAGFRPSFPPNSGFSVPDFLQFAGSQAVSVTAPLDSALSSPTTQSLLNCPKFQLNGSCVDSCPSTGYYTGANLQCTPCHVSCSSCTGLDAYHCVNCAAGFYRMMDKNLCVDRCPEFYHTDEEKKACVPCPPQCRECTRTLECKTCDSRLVLHDGQCLASCPAGLYEKDDYTCAPCDSACSTCYGPQAAHCVSCRYPTHSEFNGTCVQQCPAGFWSRDEVIGTGSVVLTNRLRQCLPCPPGCAECSVRGDGFGLACSRCKDDTQWFLDASSQLCVHPSSNHCPEGEYLVGGKCFPCHGSCAQCSGPSSSQCVLCAQNRTMYGGSCLSSSDTDLGACPQGTFNETGSDADHRPIRYCRPCPQACARCDSLDHCTECLGHLHLQDGQCLAACFEGYYSDRGICHRCHGSCRACSGPLADSCTSCSLGFSLFQKRCLSQCPLGHYNVSSASLMLKEEAIPLNTVLQLCGRCHPSCQTCTGPDQGDCRTCAEGFMPSGGSFKSCLLLTEESGPLAQFVKESEGRGARAKDDPAEASIPRDSTLSHWVVGVSASFVAGLVVVIIIQVRSTMAARYSRIPQAGQGDRRRMSRYVKETGGAETMLLSSSDLDDDCCEHDIAIPKV